MDEATLPQAPHGAPVDEKPPTWLDLWRKKLPPTCQPQGKSRECATAWCRYWIYDYERYWRTRKPLFMILVTLAIGFSGITPVAVVADWPELLQAALPALATILLAVITTYHWQDNVARSAGTAEALSIELARFLTRTRAEYHEDDETAVGHFMDLITGLRIAEVADWRAAFVDTIKLPTSQGRENTGPP